MAVLGGIGLLLGGDDEDDDDDKTLVTALEVGDCVGAIEENDSIYDVPVVDCTEPHDTEVFAAFEMTDDAYPDYNLDEVLGARCADLFEPYVGTTYEDSELGGAPFYPTPDSWKLGDREVLCMLFDVTGAPLNASMEGAEI